MKSRKGLARRLCVPLEQLEMLASNVHAQYRTFQQPKKSGGTRPISAPSERLRSVQRRIHRALLRPFKLPDYVQGCATGKTPLTNATKHVGQTQLVRIDIAQFFDSVTPRQVYRIWVEALDCSPPVAGLLTRLTTYDFALPQGAPTSPALANLVLRSVDVDIARLSEEQAIMFTRYVDDYALSGRKPEDLISFVAKRLRKEGFRVSRKKVEVMSAHRHQQITGYGTNGKAPSIGKQQRDNIRAAISQLSQMDPQAEAFSKKVLSIEGRIRHLCISNPGPAQRLEAHLGTVTAQRSGLRSLKSAEA